MRFGRFDRQITLQRATITSSSAFNSPVSIWTDLATVWASKTDVRDSERFASMQVGAETGTRFVMHYSNAIADVNPKDRLTCEDETYQIVAVKEIGRRRFIEISAVAATD